MTSDNERVESISQITAINLNQKKTQILAAQESMSRQLALRVLEKPEPRVWMIFIPIIFVFYFWKLKEYENALKDFSENHLIPGRKTLEAAFTSLESGTSVDISLLVDQVGNQQETTRLLSAEWFTLLAKHFQLLLTAKGDSYPALVRTVYQNKSNYLKFCHRVGKIEAAFNMALLENIEGDSDELLRVTKAMAEGMKDLRLQEAEQIF